MNWRIVSDKNNCKGEFYKYRFFRHFWYGKYSLKLIYKYTHWLYRNMKWVRLFKANNYFHAMYLQVIWYCLYIYFFKQFTSFSFYIDSSFFFRWNYEFSHLFPSRFFFSCCLFFWFSHNVPWKYLMVATIEKLIVLYEPFDSVDTESHRFIMSPQ